MRRGLLFGCLVAVLATLGQATLHNGVKTQPPFYPHYPTRTVWLLDGTWDFGTKDNVADVINFAAEAGDAVFNTTASVPSCFDVAPPAVDGPRTTAFYKTTFSTSKANIPSKLYFAGCSFYCQVYVDGKSLGDHRASGYSPFWIDVPPSSATQRELIVLVDNRFNKTTAPTATGGDFYFFGGIHRNVLLHEMPTTTHLDRVETYTIATSPPTIRVRAVLEAAAGGSLPSSVQLTLQFDGQSPQAPQTVSVQNGAAELPKVAVPNGQLWSMDSPNLHNLTVTVDGGDAITVRFGVRIVATTSDGHLTINGKQVKLHGYNRHTMWPDTGLAVTPAQIEQDLALLTEVNANYVRGSHYPQDQRFLDRCDELGIVVWEETLGPGVSTKDIQDPYFMQYQIDSVNEMVTASFNHPCVIFHAFFNEGPSSDKAARSGYAASAGAIRARVGNPPTRLVTWASDKGPSDVLLDLADVISFNSYPGWYQDEGDLSAPARVWGQKANWTKTNFPSKPFTISETGAGGVYEWNNNQTDAKWTLKYQTEIISRDGAFAMATDHITGITLWHLFDFKVESNCPQCNYYPHPNNLTVPWTCEYIDVSCGRPGGLNHKGSVDYWRRKKPIFDVMKGIYGGH